MKYENKKKPGTFAHVDSVDEKRKTTILVYDNGEDEGKSVCVTDSTLKRWWRKVDESVLDSIDMEQVNKPYKPDVTPHYIPKPQSVINYENKKRSRYNFDVPEFDKVVEDFGEILKKINENYKYAYFNTNSTIWRKSADIVIYAVQSDWEKLTEAGLQSEPNKDKDRPFAIRLKNPDDYEKALSALF